MIYRSGKTVRTSLSDYKINMPSNIIDMPLYAVARVKEILDSGVRDILI